MHCTNCGEEIDANHLFCNNCGAKIDVNISSSLEIKNGYEQSKKEKTSSITENKSNISFSKEAIIETTIKSPFKPIAENYTSFTPSKTCNSNTIPSAISPSFMERVFASVIDTIFNIIVIAIFSSFVPFYLIFYNNIII